MQIYLDRVQNIQAFSKTSELIFDLLDFSEGSKSEAQSILYRLHEFMKTLRPELVFLLETQYVDKDYRDIYYHYYSSKLQPFRRNCVRLSLFEPIFNNADEYFEVKQEVLNEAFRGYLVLRPLANAIIGRNAISVKAFQNQDMQICRTVLKTTCLGRKLCVKAFPHASQDGEFMTCAETTAWSIMEYFGNKYPIYSPLLPSKIKDTLQPFASERLSPSEGLTIMQISTELEKHNISAKIYSRDNYKKNPAEFKRIFTCYVESGFPLAVSATSPAITGGHAMVCVGRQTMDKTKPLSITTLQIGPQSIDYYLWNDNVNNFVYNDDNRQPYKLVPFDKPLEGYNNGLDALQITHFVVPLHEKIMLTAEMAMSEAQFIAYKVIKSPMNSVLRTFMASSRTYRNYIASNADLTTAQKVRCLQIEMPKFVWVTEISTEDEFKNNKVNALIVLDATSYSKTQLRLEATLLLIYHNCNGMVYNRKNRAFESLGVAMPNSIESFKGNLK